MTTHYPSAELVAVAWAKTVGEDVDPTKVATTLPADATTWATSGFVKVATSGGGSNADVPLHSPVITFECWAAAPDSNKAPWHLATGLAHNLLHACYARTVPRLTMPSGYYPAQLLSIYPVGGPMRIPSDEAGFARVHLDCVLAWTTSAAVAA